MLSPFVTIITPLFNAGKFITETIHSVTSQTFTDWEWIIVDDCSTDEGYEIAKKYAAIDQRIRFFRLEKNSGTGMAKNYALRFAKGRYICFIDSDDCWLPEKLEKQLLFMQEKEAAISYTSYSMMDEDGNELHRIIPVIPVLDQKKYLKTTQIGFSTSMIDRALAGEFTIIDLRSREDTHLWIDLLGKGLLAYGLDEVLVRYRVHSHSITTNKLKAAYQTWNLYYRTEKLGLLSSVYYFCHYALNALKKHYL